MEKPVDLPDEDGKIIKVAPRDLGISYPLLFNFSRAYDEDIPLPGANPDPQQAGAQGGDAKGLAVTVRRCDFTIQFAWKETPMDKRKEALDKQKKTESEKPPAMASPALPGAAPLARK